MQGFKKISSHPCCYALARWGLLFLLFPQLGWATGTPAGTVITNSATVSYTVGAATPPPVTSAPATLTVDELIQPVLTWQDGASVAVNSPGANDALTFTLTNSGNGQEAFDLTRTNGPAPFPAGNFTPTNGSVGSIYLENGLQAGFQASGPNADTVYVPGVNDPDLAADATQKIYVISDTPANVATNALGEVKLTATSLTAGAAAAATPGTSTAGLVGCAGACSAVFATAYGQASLTGNYIASGLGLVLNKAIVSVLDPNNTAVLMPGAVITYQITATLSGTGTATNLVITDTLDTDTTYFSESIVVGGVTKTDAVDGDSAQSVANTITVSLGNVAAPASFVITFRATIN